jgi:beta-glucanase (GH16 family)
MKKILPLGVAAFLGAAGVLPAANRTWIDSAGDGSFATSANWSGGVVPANNDYQDTAIFGSPSAPRCVHVPAGRSIFGLRFETAGWSLTGSAFNDIRNVYSAGSGTNSTAQLLNQKYSGNWTVAPGNNLVLGGGLYQRNYNITLTGGGTLRVGSAITGYGGTAGAWGVHLQDATLRVNAASPYSSTSAGAVFLEAPGARLQLLSTVASVQTLIGTRIVDGLGGGLQVADLGGGVVEVSPASPAGSDPVPPMPGNWTVTFQDEFHGTILDGMKWRLGQHWAGIAGSAGVAPENVTVNGGTLRIKSEQRPVSYGGANFSYASGEVSSFFQFRQQYGYFEARIKYPAVTGLWPAFWLMPDRGDYGWKDGFYRSLVKFDLTGVNPGPITSAELKLKVSAVESGNSNNLVFMKVSDDAWTESTVTWNTMPVPDPVWIAQRWNQAVAGQDVTIDVKDFVAQQMAGDKKISFMVADTFLKTKNVKFHSREAANQADRPRLVINGVTHYASEDAHVRWGTLANTNYGSAVELAVEDSWGDTATTFNGGMEVDILEALGIWGADETHHALHWDGYGSSHHTTGWSNVFSPATDDGFHTYGVYWQPGLLEFYVDGVRTATWSNARVMSVPAYMILSLQLGGWDNNIPGAQVHNQVMEVDWVRAWSGTRSGLTAMVVDNSHAANLVVTGSWTNSTANSGYYAANYAHDGNEAKGTKVFSFKPPITTSGTYQVYARWTSGTNRASNVPLEIVKADGSLTTLSINQQNGGSQWSLLGTYPLAPANAEVRLRTDATNGFVIADAIRVVPAP